MSWLPFTWKRLSFVSWRNSEGSTPGNKHTHSASTVCKDVIDSIYGNTVMVCAVLSIFSCLVIGDGQKQCRQGLTHKHQNWDIQPALLSNDISMNNVATEPQKKSKNNKAIENTKPTNHNIIQWTIDTHPSTDSRKDTKPSTTSAGQSGRECFLHNESILSKVT